MTLPGLKLRSVCSTDPSFMVPKEHKIQGRSTCGGLKGLGEGDRVALATSVSSAVSNFHLIRSPSFCIHHLIFLFIIVPMNCLGWVVNIFKLFPFLLGCAGSSLLWGFFSSSEECGLLCSCLAWDSHCSGFSCGAWALGQMPFSSCS